jgi:phosphoglycerate dehydrogenase-like enzyme
MMVQIALSNQLMQQYGAQIQNVAPSVVELLALDDSATRRIWNDAEILINSEFTNELSAQFVIASMPRLRWIHSVYAGLDDIASPELASRSIVITNSAGIYAPMMSEYIVAMLVALYRNLPRYVLAQTRHVWERFHSPALPSEELYGKRMGILGYGSIGRYLAPIARALGMKVWGLRRTPTLLCNEPLDQMLSPNELDTLLLECDVIVIAASLNSSTHRLLGTRELGLMKRGAVLVNVARGAIVDEVALVEALRKDHLRGAVLDATTIEPLSGDSPLWNAPNLLITPHISGDVSLGLQRSIDLFCDNLRLYLEGQPNHFGNRVSLSAHL